MKKFEKIDLWAIRIGMAIITIVFLKTCTTNTRIIKSEESVTHQIDSLTNIININNNLLRREIKIEGLRSEKRMIQSTDRKILDVSRQSEIDKEISELEK